MRTPYLVIAMLILMMVTACSGPRIKLFSDTIDPLKEFTLEGSGKDKILLIPVNGLISDMPKKGLIHTSASVVEQIVSQINKAEKDKQIKAV